jgi:hypothetical protein
MRGLKTGTPRGLTKLAIGFSATMLSKNGKTAIALLFSGCLRILDEENQSWTFPY